LSPGRRGIRHIKRWVFGPQRVLQHACIWLSWIQIRYSRNKICINLIFFFSDPNSKSKKITLHLFYVWFYVFYSLKVNFAAFSRITIKMFRKKQDKCKNKLFYVISKHRSGFGSKQIRVDFCSSDPHTDKCTIRIRSGFTVYLFVAYMFICMWYVRFSAVFRIRDILGSLDPYKWFTDPDPAFSSVTSKIPTKNKFFSNLFCFLLSVSTLASVVKDKKPLRIH
jgi:hypothetical protein